MLPIKMLVFGFACFFGLAPSGRSDGPVAPVGADVIAGIERWNQDMFQHVAPRVVFISNRSTSGSGFFVSEDGLILTNAHVVRGARSVKVVQRDGKVHTGRVVERGLNNVDLALVKIDAKTPKLNLSSTGLKVGSWVGSVGHGTGGIWTFNTGMVTNIYATDRDNRSIVQTQIPLNHGNSGGPLVNRDGIVVGVVTAGIDDANAVNFAIRIDVAFESLDGLGCDCLQVRAPKGVPVFLDGKLLGKGPLLRSTTVQPGEHEVTAIVKGRKRQAKFVYPKTKRITIK